MPNPTPAEFTVQIGPTYTIDTSAELTAWAAVQGRSVSAVTRECTEEGLERLRRAWLLDHGPIPADVLAAATQDVKERGDRQAARKRKVAKRARQSEAA
jgi:hypothetical protein